MQRLSKACARTSHSIVWDDTLCHVPASSASASCSAPFWVHCVVRQG